MRAVTMVVSWVETTDDPLAALLVVLWVAKKALKMVEGSVVLLAEKEVGQLVDRKVVSWVGQLVVSKVVKLVAR